MSFLEAVQLLKKAALIHHRDHQKVNMELLKGNNQAGTTSERASNLAITPHS